MNVSKISLLAQCYETMRANALVATKAEFSTRWLGRQPSYLTSMIAKERTPSFSVISYFADRLQSYAESYASILASPHAQLFRARYDALLQVLTNVEQFRLWEMMEQSDAEVGAVDRRERARIDRLRSSRPQ